LFIRQQTAVINVIRAHLAEFGIVAPVGRKGVEALLDVVANPTDKRVPVIARACLAALGAQLCSARQQDCADGVGADGQGRALQETHRAGA
jgi:transposase